MESPNNSDVLEGVLDVYNLLNVKLREQERMRTLHSQRAYFEKKTKDFEHGKRNKRIDSSTRCDHFWR